MASVNAIARRPRAGFTLIELLASMTILIFIVMMMSRLFAESTQVWSAGTKRSNTAGEARVIMDYIVKEMTQAIADEVVTFKLNSGGDIDPDHAPRYGLSAYGAASDEVCFVGMVRSGDPGYRRTGNQYVYFIAPMLDENGDVMDNRYRLVRTRRTASMYMSEINRTQSAYKNREWWTHMDVATTESGGVGLLNPETMAENVAGFEVWAYSERTGDYEFSYTSADEDNMLPLWVDLYLEMLSEDEAQRAAILWDVDAERAKEYVELNAKRYTARVFFPNRERAHAFR